MTQVNKSIVSQKPSISVMKASEGSNSNSVKAIFLSLAGCLQCNYIFPLLKLANKLNLVEVVEFQSFDDKELYHKSAVSILDKWNIDYSSEPIPVPLILISTNNIDRIVNQTLIDECTFAIKDSFDDMELLEFLDLEINDHKLVVNLFSKIIAETIF
jgi:hypothetical protein